MTRLKVNRVKTWTWGDEYDSGSEHEGEGGYLMVHLSAYIYGQLLNTVPEGDVLMDFQVPANIENEVF